MKKYLFFRTDRVGDFLLTSIILKGIKRKEPFSEITVIASEKNYDFIETMSYVDKVLLFPKSLKLNIKKPIIVPIIKTSIES